MSTVSLLFDNLQPSSFQLNPIVNHGSDIQMSIQCMSSTEMIPGEQLALLVVSEEYYQQNPTADYNSLLDKTQIDDNFNGIYRTVINNGSSYTDYKSLTYPVINISDNFENSKFVLFWKQSVGLQKIYDSNLDPVYTCPHNIRSDEIEINARFAINEVSADTTTMCYTIKINGFKNDSIDNYDGLVHKAYAFRFQVYLPYVTNVRPEVFRINGWIETGATNNPTITPSDNMDLLYFSPEDLSNGVRIHLPFFKSDNIPNKYTFRAFYVGINGKHTFNKSIMLDHGKFDVTFKETFDGLDKDTIKNSLNRIGEIRIPKGEIQFRKRLAVGIEDITVKRNIYKKQGTFISKYYDLDKNLYSLSLNVDEYIPSYPNIYNYSVIRYYVDFGNNQWVPISPTHRLGEISNDSKTIPKVIVFDIEPPNSEQTDQILYMDLANIRTFRIKIVFDLSSLKDAEFIPPEVRGYKCIIQDKGKILG